MQTGTGLNQLLTPEMAMHARRFVLDQTTVTLKFFFKTCESRAPSVLNYDRQPVAENYSHIGALPPPPPPPQFVVDGMGDIPMIDTERQSEKDLLASMGYNGSPKV
jgi:hypothetical protein